jgi:hypothetical protein
VALAEAQAQLVIKGAERVRLSRAFGVAVPVLEAAGLVPGGQGGRS